MLFTIPAMSDVQWHRVPWRLNTAFNALLPDGSRSVVFVEQMDFTSKGNQNTKTLASILGAGRQRVAVNVYQTQESWKPYYDPLPLRSTL